jgi:hypothetical protein
MNAENRCIVDYFIAANQGVLEEAIPQAQEMVEAGTTTEAGQFIVTCERCEVDFALSPEVGQKGKMVVAKMPSKPSIACVEARFHEPYEWVTNLSPRWFDLKVIKPKDTTSSAEKGGDAPKVSLEGLEDVLSDAAQNVARDRRARDRGVAVLTPYALSTSRLLDKILPRPDDSTWGTEISERATNIGDQAT